MRAPYVGAVVQVRPPRSLDWKAAIVTGVCHDRKQLTGTAWIAAVDVAIFLPNGDVLPARWVGRMPESADEFSDCREDFVWRWPPEVAS